MTQTQEQNVPALRFPEFSGEWELKTLLNLSKDGFSNGVFNDPKNVGTGYRLINVKDMYKGNEIALEDLSFLEISKKEFEKNKVVWGDVFFTRSSLVKEGIAYSSVFLSNAEDITYDGHLIKMSPDGNKVFPQYLGYALKTNILRRQLVARGKTTTMTTIGQEDIASVAVMLSGIIEQQKIATFLSSVDRKIAQLGQKKALLQRYKKGMMQKLFSGELRFKDAQGHDFPDWEEKRLGKLSKITTGKLDANAMVPDGLYRFYTCAKQHFQIDKFAFDTDALLVSGNGANVGYVHHYKGKFNAYQRTYVLDEFRENIFYVKFYLDFFLKRRIDVEKKDGNTPYIVMSTLSEMVVALPCMNEQQKIADFLSSIDRKIDLVSTELDHTKIFKKGLLHQMFI